MPTSARIVSVGHTSLAPRLNRSPWALQAEAVRAGVTDAGLRPQDVDGLSEGTVVTFAVYHRSYHPAFQPLVPYVVAVVELAEALRLVSNVVGVTLERVRVGMRVRVGFQSVGETAPPVFRPVGEGD